MFIITDFSRERILPHWLNVLWQKLKSWEFTVEMCFYQNIRDGRRRGVVISNA